MFRSSPHISSEGGGRFPPANIQHSKNENKGKNVHISIFIISDFFVYVYYVTYLRNASVTLVAFCVGGGMRSVTERYALRVTQAQNGVI